MKPEDRRQSDFLFLSVCTAFILLFFSAPQPACSQELSLFSFGSGKIQVRLYANYFCGPCGKLEPEIEPIIQRLVKNNTITISFIDIAFHRQSAMYARYFLYSLNNHKNLDQALKIRRMLFEASKVPIEDEEKLEMFLTAKGIGFRKFDEKPVFFIFQNYVQEDRINSTPSCTVIDNSSKNIYYGREDVLKALENIEQSSNRKTGEKKSPTKK